MVDRCYTACIIFPALISLLTRLFVCFQQGGLLARCCATAEPTRSAKRRLKLHFRPRANRFVKIASIQRSGENVIAETFTIFFSSSPSLLSFRNVKLIFKIRLAAATTTDERSHARNTSIKKKKKRNKKEVCLNNRLEIEGLCKPASGAVIGGLLSSPSIP